MRQTFPFERLITIAVIPLMLRLRITCALLSALWLVASLHCVFGSIDELPAGSCCGTAATSEQSHSTSSPERCLMGESSTWSCRRLDNGNSQSLQREASESFSNEATPLALVSVWKESDLVVKLAHGWQFQCRAALPPRTPCNS